MQPSEQELITILMSDPKIDEVITLSYDHFLKHFPDADKATKADIFKTAFLQGIVFSQLVLNKGEH